MSEEAEKFRGAPLLLRPHEKEEPARGGSHLSDTVPPTSNCFQARLEDGGGGVGQ